MLYSCRYYLYQLFFPFKNLCGRVFSTHSFMATRHNLKKKSARLNNRNVSFEYSRQPPVSRTMYSEWNVTLCGIPKMSFFFKILLRDYVELIIFLDNMVVLKILKIDHFDCEKFMFTYQQNSSHLGKSSLYFVSHLGWMIFQ